MYIKWMETCIKIRVLTVCCCAGSDKEGVMENIKRDKCVHKVNGHMNKKKQEYLQTVVQRVVVKKVARRT